MYVYLTLELFIKKGVNNKIEMTSIKDLINSKTETLSDIFNILKSLSKLTEKNKKFYWGKNNFEDFLIYCVRKIERGEPKKIKSELDKIIKEIPIYDVSSYNSFKKFEEVGLQGFENNFNYQVNLIREFSYFVIVLNMASKALGNLNGNSLKLVGKRSK